MLGARPLGRRSAIAAVAMAALWSVPLPVADGSLRGRRPAAPEAATGFVTTDDFYLAEQWGLFSWGQRVGGEITTTPDIDARVPEAWAVTMGDPDVVVAVVDTGLALQHPDLAGNVWTNPGETGGGREDNGADDDGNGFVDDWRGWDFVDDDNDPADVRGELLGVETAMFHGTAVASVIAAEAGNGIGIAGVAPRARVMALRALGDRALDDAMADAIEYAAANGARIVNLSIATFIPGFGVPATAAAIDRHPEVLFVAAAGNSANDADVLSTEPCTVPGDNLICVAAHDQDGERAVFTASPTQQGTNIGRVSVDLAAPGDNIIHATAPIDVAFEEPFDDPLRGRWEPDGGTGWTHDPGGGALVVDVDGAGSTHAIRSSTAVDTEGRGCRLEVELRTDMPPGGLLRVLQSVDGGRFVARSGPGSITVGGTTDDELHTVALPDTEALRLGFELRTPPAGGRARVSIDSVRVTCTSDDYTDRDYAYAEGTSFAAPHVTGAAALILAVAPELTPAEVRAVLLETAVPSALFSGATVAGGRLDAHAALVAVERGAAGDSGDRGGRGGASEDARRRRPARQAGAAGGPVVLPLPDTYQPVPGRRGGAPLAEGRQGSEPVDGPGTGGDGDEGAAVSEEGSGAGSGTSVAAVAAALAVAAVAAVAGTAGARRRSQARTPTVGLQLPTGEGPAVPLPDVAAARALGTAGALAALSRLPGVSPDNAAALEQDAADVEGGLGGVVRVLGQHASLTHDYNFIETLVSIYGPVLAHRMYNERRLREMGALSDLMKSLGSDRRDGPMGATTPGSGTAPHRAPASVPFRYDPKTGTVDVMLPEGHGRATADTGHEG